MEKKDLCVILKDNNATIICNILLQEGFLNVNFWQRELLRRGVTALSSLKERVKNKKDRK